MRPRGCQFVTKDDPFIKYVEDVVKDILLAITRNPIRSGGSPSMADVLSGYNRIIIELPPRGLVAVDRTEKML